MKELIKPVSLYSILWCLYYCLLATTSEGGRLTRLLLFTILIISFYCFVRVSFLRKPSYFKGLTALFALFTLYGIFRFFDTPIVINASVYQPLNFLKNAFVSLLPLYAYYYFSIKGQITDKWFLIWTFIFLAVVIYCFYGAGAKYWGVSIKDSLGQEFTNNTGYLFVGLFPLAVFQKKPILRYGLFAILLVFVFMSMKRGALICSGAMLLYAFWYYSHNSSKRRKILIVCGGLLALVGMFYLARFFVNNSEYFVQRISDTMAGESSHRDVLFSKIWEEFKISSFWAILFGHGADSTIRLCGQLAHNDWLEILFNHGIFGIIIYIIYWKCFIRSSRMGKMIQPVYLAMIMVLINTFLKSLFSMSINDIPFYESCILGYCLALVQEKNYN